MAYEQEGPTLGQSQDWFPIEDRCLDHWLRIRYGADFDCPGCGRPAKFTL